jgi:hypothetical protein
MGFSRVFIRKPGLFCHPRPSQKLDSPATINHCSLDSQMTNLTAAQERRLRHDPAEIIP